MSENCSACGAKRTMFEGQTSWDCGSYQSLLGGSHIKTPQFKLIQSELCKSRVDLATLRAQVAQLTAERDALAKFKAYTHQPLDELGAPPEVPESEHTKAGCRIGGRFDWVRYQLAVANSEVERLRKRDQQWQEEAFISLAHCEAVGADKAAAVMRTLLLRMGIEEPSDAK